MSRSAVLPAGDHTVLLNSCYAVRAPDEVDAHALCAIINSTVAAGWLNVLAEPARGGFHRYLAWTVGLLPIPGDWARARAALGPVGERAAAGGMPDGDELSASVAAAYGLASGALAPLLSWPEGMTLQVVDAAAARAAVAGCWLERTDDTQAQLGAVSLQPHQMAAVREIRTLMTGFGGALLADEVGLGKTFVGLALAREARRPLVIAPMGLRGMWLQAAARAGVRVTMWSADALSRGESAPRIEGGWDLIIVNEAHHFRNPLTRRYRALARLTAGIRILLLSATPVHNRTGDLVAMLELFLGARARSLTDDERARYVVRRKPSMVAPLEVGAGPASRVPAVDGPHRLALRDDHETLDALVALPDAVPPRMAATPRPW